MTLRKELSKAVCYRQFSSVFILNEFAKLLKSHDIGVNICNVKISSLFWADDIVLLANDERELQFMLDLAATFANKWKLSFNHEKSNVLIVGRRMDALRMWRLGDSYISEVNTYKYLGVTFSRNLSDHNHINDVVKKGNRLIGYVKSIIDGHDDFQWRSIMEKLSYVLYQLCISRVGPRWS